ncbi:MAG: hypothetical protein ACYCS9_11430 [Candidatus Dormibacteria bacterium]
MIEASAIAQVGDEMNALQSSADIHMHDRARPNRRELARARTGRHLLRVIDDLLGELEDLHEAGQCLKRRRACQQFVGRITRRLRIMPPEGVLEARTSYALHAALLEWQAAIFDWIVPGRREMFPDLQERDEWTVPSLRQVVRRRSRQSSLSGAA